MSPTGTTGTATPRASSSAATRLAKRCSISTTNFMFKHIKQTALITPSPRGLGQATAEEKEKSFTIRFRKNSRAGRSRWTPSCSRRSTRNLKKRSSSAGQPPAAHQVHSPRGKVKDCKNSQSGSTTITTAQLMQYHPGATWLRANRHDPGSSSMCTSPRQSAAQPRPMAKHPYVILHELAHAYHDQVLEGGFKNKAVADAYNEIKKNAATTRCCSTGRTVKHYASHDGVFAESTEAYLGVNDFTPSSVPS